MGLGSERERGSLSCQTKSCSGSASTPDLVESRGRFLELKHLLCDVNVVVLAIQQSTDAVARMYLVRGSFTGRWVENNERGKGVLYNRVWFLWSWRWYCSLALSMNTP